MSVFRWAATLSLVVAMSAEAVPFLRPYRECEGALWKAPEFVREAQKTLRQCYRQKMKPLGRGFFWAKDRLQIEVEVGCVQDLLRDPSLQKLDNAQYAQVFSYVLAGWFRPAPLSLRPSPVGRSNDELEATNRYILQYVEKALDTALSDRRLELEDLQRLQKSLQYLYQKVPSPGCFMRGVLPMACDWAVMGGLVYIGTGVPVFLPFLTLYDYGTRVFQSASASWPGEKHTFARMEDRLTREMLERADAGVIYAEWKKRFAPILRSPQHLATENSLKVLVNEILDLLVTRQASVQTSLDVLLPMIRDMGGINELLYREVLSAWDLIRLWSLWQSGQLSAQQLHQLRESLQKSGQSWCLARAQSALDTLMEQDFVSAPTPQIKAIR